MVIESYIWRIDDVVESLSDFGVSFNKVTVSLKRIDFREKLDRLTEDRAYDNKVIKEELGFNPRPFEEHIKSMI